MLFLSKSVLWTEVFGYLKIIGKFTKAPHKSRLEVTVSGTHSPSIERSSRKPLGHQGETKNMAFDAERILARWLRTTRLFETQVEYSKGLPLFIMENNYHDNKNHLLYVLYRPLLFWTFKKVGQVPTFWVNDHWIFIEINQYHYDITSWLKLLYLWKYYKLLNILKITIHFMNGRDTK